MEKKNSKAGTPESMYSMVTVLGREGLFLATVNYLTVTIT